MPVEREIEPRDRQRHLAALEALFAPKPPAAPPPPPSARAVAKIVLVPPAAIDPRKERLVARLLGAEGPHAVARATTELERAGFAVPEDQEASLRMLEHPDEARVRCAIATLVRVLGGALPKRRAILDGRLRRIEELAEEAGTRDVAAKLRAHIARGQA